MAVWQITVSGKGLREETVKKIAESIVEKYGDKATVYTKDASPPESRADRLSAALGLVSDARAEVENLRDEMEEWHDSIPDNLKDGSKASEVEEAKGALAELVDKLEDAEGQDVSFPSMM